MFRRLLTATLLSGAMMTTACAQEQNADDKMASAATAKPIATPASEYANTNAADWRDLDPENTLYITTKHGTFVVELAPEFAPKHVAQIKKLTRQKFYDGITFHRVIDGFMNQTGDPRGDGTGDSSEPDIPAEFTFRRGADMKVTLVGRELTKDGEMDVGFYKAFPVAVNPISQAMFTKDQKVKAWGLHCFATTSMARGGGNVNSANSQFFLMRAKYPSLNQSYSIWGRVVHGKDYLDDIKIGVVGEDPNFIPDMMDTVRVAADVPESERIPVQVMRTNSPAFKAHLDKLKADIGRYPEVCNIDVPSRLKP